MAVLHIPQADLAEVLLETQEETADLAEQELKAVTAEQILALVAVVVPRLVSQVKAVLVL